MPTVKKVFNLKSPKGQFHLFQLFSDYPIPIMSEAALNKIQIDCAKMELELEVYKSSLTLTNACEL